MVEEMIPAVAAWYAASHFAEEGRPLFIDVFCEEHAFDVDQSRRILAAGLAAGMRPKATWTSSTGWAVCRWRSRWVRSPSTIWT
ncbi:MAG: hypothetical protein R2838_03415 [Caldilineaceae bacterium]